jgi:plasmid stabilization system protein ParE
VRSVAFHPEAETEFIAAARYYESQAENLGLDFIAAVESTYQRLFSFPESGRPFGSRLRRILVPGFPYGLVYRREPDRVFIVAVAHVRRRPGYWRARS